MKFLILLSAVCVVVNAAENSESESRLKPIHVVMVQERSSSAADDNKQSKRSTFGDAPGIGYGVASPVPYPSGVAFAGSSFASAAVAPGPPIGVGAIGVEGPPPGLYTEASLGEPAPFASGYAPSFAGVAPAHPPICGANPCPVPVPISQTVEITKPVPVPVYKTVAVAVPQPVPYPVPHPVAVKVPQPYPVEVPVIKNVPYPVEKPIPVPYPVEKPYPVKVWKKVPVFIPKPYPVHIYKVKHIYHTKHHKKDWGW